MAKGGSKGYVETNLYGSIASFFMGFVFTKSDALLTIGFFVLAISAFISFLRFKEFGSGDNKIVKSKNNGRKSNPKKYDMMYWFSKITFVVALIMLFLGFFVY